MENLIEAIRVALAEGATDDQRRAGADACRAALAILEPAAPPGPPTPAAPASAPAAPRPDPGAVLDLLIARLGALAEAKERASGADASADATAPAELAPAPLAAARPAFRIPFVPVPHPRGGRIP